MSDLQPAFDEDRPTVRLLYWLTTGGEGDLPWGLRAFWKLMAWSMVTILCYVLATQQMDTFGFVVVTVLAAFAFVIALFGRLGWD